MKAIPMRARRWLVGLVGLVAALAALLVSLPLQADECPEGYPVECESYCCPEGAACGGDRLCAGICRGDYPISCGNGACCPEGSTCGYGVCVGECPTGYPVSCGGYCCPQGTRCEDNGGVACVVDAAATVGGGCPSSHPKYCLSNICCPEDTICSNEFCFREGVEVATDPRVGIAVSGADVLTAVELYREQPACAVRAGRRGSWLVAVALGAMALALAGRRSRR